MKPIHAWLAAVACLALWIVLAFVAAIPSGWVHAPLAAGTALLAAAIILSPPANGSPGA